MSQDLKRERATTNIRVGHGIHLYNGDTPIGTMLTADWAARVVEAVANAKYYSDLATSQAARLVELTHELDAANTKLAEADEALEQARRDAGQDGKLAQVAEWLAKREATAASRASEAISPAADGFNDLGGIESRAAKLRRAQSDGKLLHELRILLNGLEQPRQPTVRYWLRDWGTGPYSVVRQDDSNAATWYLRFSTEWQLYARDCVDELLHATGEIREITAAELPAGVTP